MGSESNGSSVRRRASSLSAAASSDHNAGRRNQWQLLLLVPLLFERLGSEGRRMAPARMADENEAEGEAENDCDEANEG